MNFAESYEYRQSTQTFTIKLMIGLWVIVQSPNLYAAPEDRGMMGGTYAFSSGGYVMTGQDGESNRLPSQYGYSFALFLGEEVLPKLCVGIHFDTHLDQFSNGEEPSNSQMFAFGLEGRMRVTGQERGLYILGGIGIGAGGFLAQGESLTEAEASSGGSIWKLGLGYELGGEKISGFTYSPKLIFQRLGPQMESTVGVNVVSLGLEILYATGRQSSTND